MKPVSLLLCALLFFLGGCTTPLPRPDRISTPPLHFAVP